MDDWWDSRFCKRAADGSNPFAVVKPENKYKGKPSYKISTAGKVHLVYLLANIAKFKNRKEVLNTIFLLKCGAVIARLH